MSTSRRTRQISPNDFCTGTRMPNIALRDSHPSTGVSQLLASTETGTYLRMPSAMTGARGTRPITHNILPKLCYTLLRKMKRSQGPSRRSGSSVHVGMWETVCWSVFGKVLLRRNCWRSWLSKGVLVFVSLLSCLRSLV